MNVRSYDLSIRESRSTKKGEKEKREETPVAERAKKRMTKKKLYWKKIDISRKRNKKGNKQEAALAETDGEKKKFQSVSSGLPTRGAASNKLIKRSGQKGVTSELRSTGEKKKKKGHQPMLGGPDTTGG